MFQDSISVLSLAVSFRVECSRQQAINLQAFIQVFLEFGYELRTSVKDHRARQAIEFLDIRNIEPGNLFSVTGIITGYKIAHLRESIYYDEDSVAFLAGWQVRDEVH